jgi:CheY-like chemotaxis protein
MASDPSAMGVGQNPSIETVKFRTPTPAPLYRASGASDAKSSSSVDSQEQGANESELISALLKMLKGSPTEKGISETGRFNWDRKRVLVCVTPSYRETIASTLAESGYQVYVAEDAIQAIDRMREERIEVVVLATDFDPEEQGIALVTNEVSALRPTERRRLIFVQLSETVRTGDSHAAFVNNVNAVLHPADVMQLPQLLDRTMRDLNELYKNFNLATAVTSF